MTQRGGRLGRFSILAAVLAISLSACTASDPTHVPIPVHPSTRPNIVFVLTDDLSSDLVRYMPHVRAMEQEGTSFSHYFVVDSLCCPSRTAILTGEYPHNNGVYTNSGPDGGYTAFGRRGNAVKTYGVALQRAGYRTALMGKYLNRYFPYNPPAPGWNEWDATGAAYHEFDYSLNQNGDVHEYGHNADDYLTDVLSAKAGDFVRNSTQAGKPFAIEVSTFAPHLPYIPAPRDAGTFPGLHAPRGPAFDRSPANAPGWFSRLPALSAHDVHRIDRAYQRRVESVQAVDAMIGHLQQVVRAQGVAKNTYFVFTSDNGYHMGEYRMMPGKQTAFDTDINVPLVVTGPGVPAARQVDAMTSSIDLAPTFEAIAAAKPTDTPDGTSMLALWHGVAPSAQWQHSILVEHRGPVTDPTDPDVQQPRSGNPPSYEAIRTPTALYVEYKNGTREYYDLARDPYELDNLAGTASPSTLFGLHRALHALENCRGAASCQGAARLG